MKRCLTVLEPGPLTTVQDWGRAGWAHLGVPRSGALDRSAAALANRLVGNPDQSAVLETTLGGVALRVSTAMTLAVVGADALVTVDDRPVPLAEPLAVTAGQTLRVGPARSGLRSYVAAAGGIDVPEVLGSRSTDTLSGLGPPPVTGGTELPVGTPVGDPHGVDVSVVPRIWPSVTLRFLPGPRADWFIDQALARLTGSAYAVSSDSNRVGLRLDGPGLSRKRHEEMPSEGMVLGGIQVPASGKPLVFLNDHPTTGGYPIVGVVVAEDLRSCAQLRPGDEVRFTHG